MWVASSTFRVGPLHIGVRSTTAEVDSLLRRALAAYLVDGLEAPPNYSVGVSLEEGAVRGAQPLHLLYRSRCLVRRSTSAATIFATLLSYLSAHHDGNSADGLLKLGGAALVRGEEAVVVSQALMPAVAARERALNRAGLRVAHDTHVRLDPANGELVVLAPSLEVDPGALKALRHRYPSELAGTEPVAPGRYRVTAWVLERVPGELEPAEHPVALAHLLPLVVNRHELGRTRALGGLVTAVRGAVTLAAGSLRPEEILRRLPAHLPA